MSRINKFLIILLFIFSSTSFAQTLSPRIISLTPSLTDLVVDLGGADLLVGVSSFDKQRLPILRQVESIGNFGSYSLEAIIKLRPDIILVWPTTITPQQHHQLVSLGYKIVERDPHTLNDLITDITYVGEQIGKKEQSEVLARQLQQDIAQLREKYHRKKPINVFYQISDKPLYTIGKKQIIGDALSVCGAKNIFDDIDFPAPQVNIETILIRDPQVIIASKQLLLNNWQVWPQLSAVKNKRLILFQDDRIARPSIGMIKATKKLCQLLNAE